MKLNVGSGPHYAEGWYNVDLYAEDADLQASVYHLTDHLKPESCTHVYVGHVLEHLVWNRIPSALREIREVMAPGGTLMVVGPCILRAVATRQPTHILEAILSDPRESFDGHGHAWTPTEALTLEAVQTVFPDASLTSVSNVRKPEWPNPDTALWQCAVMATI